MPQAPPRFRARSRLSARALNQLADLAGANAELVAGVKGVQPGATRVARFEIKTLGSDDLTCILPGQSGNGSAATWTVELPEIYTEASRGGVSYTYTNINQRTATDTPDSETQYLTPPLTVGETLLAFDDDGTWRMFGDGRMWAIDP